MLERLIADVAGQLVYVEQFASKKSGEVLYRHDILQPSAGRGGPEIVRVLCKTNGRVIGEPVTIRARVAAGKKDGEIVAFEVE